jgi:transcriptional regulator with XRE-family HTH domain
MGIGRQIRKYRLKSGLTLERLSEACGVEPGTINALENRDSSRSKYFPVIAKALGLSMEQLADESSDFDLVLHHTDGSKTYLELKESAPRPYGWPFKELTPKQWSLLSDSEQQHIEATALILIRARDDPKHTAPANNVASA